MSRFVLAVALCLLFFGTAAYADITVSLGGVPCKNAAGLCSPIASASTITFDTLLNSVVDPQSFTLSNGIATYSWTPNPVSPFVRGSVPNEAAAPPFDLVLLDLNMPEMSAEEALPLIRELSPSSRVVITSGFTESEAMRQLPDASVAGFVQKPYTVQALVRQLATLVARREGRSA